MSTNRQQDRDFKEALDSEMEITIKDSALQTAIDWIGGTLDPDDVFNNKSLESWAVNNGFIKETEIDYKEWAESNGYTKE